MKTCSNPFCEAPVKLEERFYKSRHTQDNLQSWCKDCTKARVAQGRSQTQIEAIIYNMERELRILKNAMIANMKCVSRGRP